MVDSFSSYFSSSWSLTFWHKKGIAIEATQSEQCKLKEVIWNRHNSGCHKGWLQRDRIWPVFGNKGDWFCFDGTLWTNMHLLELENRNSESHHFFLIVQAVAHCAAYPQHHGKNCHDNYFLFILLIWIKRDALFRRVAGLFCNLGNHLLKGALGIH